VSWPLGETQHLAILERTQDRDKTFVNTLGNKLAVVINGQAVIEYDRNKPLPGLQRRYLDQLDQDMDEGFMLGDVRVDDPNAVQRAQFIANHLVNAIEDDNDAVIAATCAYLANRLPSLKQVRATDSDEGMTIDLIFDQALDSQVAVDFDPGTRGGKPH